jgi:hypothetical protein
MANTATTFSDYFDGLPNPFVPPAAQYGGFAAVPAIQPQGILASLESTQYPSVLVASRTDDAPALYLAPFAAATLPGVAPPANKYAFYGDFSQAGNPPALLSITANFFHLSPNVTVLAAADVVAAWAAAPIGTHLLPPPDAGDVTEQVQTRNSMPVPHEYTRAVIVAHANGNLTWEWLWANVGVPILGDAQQSADYLPFTDHLRVAMTQRAPAAAGGAIRAPATVLEFTATHTTPALQDQAMAKAREFLPGLRQPVGVGAQLNLIAQQQLAQGMVLANAQQDRPATMARKAPALLGQVHLLCEVPVGADESELAPFWLQYPGVPTGRWMGSLKAVILRLRSAISAEGGPLLTAPILTAAFVTDIGEGNFFAEDMDDVTGGLSVFRTRPANSANADGLQAQNRMYSLLVSGTGVAQASTVQMLVTNKEIEIPTDPFIFAATLEGYYLIMRAVAGRHNRGVTNLYNAIIRDVNEFARQIQNRYREPAHFAYACLLVETFIFRKMNTYIVALMSSPAPATIGGGTAIPPDFMRIRDALVDGNLSFLTELPPAIATYTSQYPGEPAKNLPPAVNELNKVPGTKIEGATGREQVSHPEWNQNLKRAWTSSGAVGLYSTGSPFRDESQPNKKKKIPSDTQGVRICLAMALNGTCYSNCNGLHKPLNEREVQRVAEAGGLTVE